MLQPHPHVRRPAPLPLFIALTLGLGALAGCMADRAPVAPGTPDAALAFPQDYTIIGTEPGARNDTSARFTWSGTAGLGVGSEVDLQVTAPPELALPVPSGLPLALYIEMRYPGRAEVWLTFEVTNEAREAVCPLATERLDGDTWLNRCGTGLAPLVAPETWTVRVRAMANIDPTATFTIEIVWRIVPPREPVPSAPLGAIDYEPHVVVGITDSGVNPYHTVYQRPERTLHPCTYVQGYPCDIPALPLSIGMYDDYWTAVAADQQVWASVEPDTWYWVPGTNLIGVHCAAESRWRPACILDENGHGTYTSSTVVQENPHALIAITMGDAEDMSYILDAPFPVDLVSFSWAPPIPIIADEERVYVRDCQEWTQERYTGRHTLFVAGAGNVPGASPTTLIDCATGNPNIITVGGAFASDETQSLMATWHPDVVSWFCRPAARAATLDEFGNPCGTSFATPTVAGALSKVILNLRHATGYTGSARDGITDPVALVSHNDIRDAMNLTATYEPHANHTNAARLCLPPTPACAPTGLPRNDAAPWTQWGWGFYDTTTTDATLAHLLGDTAPDRPDARAWMEAQHTVKRELWGR